MYFLRLIVALLPVAAVQFSPYDKSQLSPASFFEQFDYADLKSSGWVVSSGKKENQAYNGKWKIQPSHKYPGYDGDNGLVMASEAAYFAISKKMPSELVFDGEDLVFQYELKFQNGVTCAGAYFKLLSDFEPEKFSASDSYEVMFGPDICGSGNRVSFLYTKTTESEGTKACELRTPPMAQTSPLSVLYTLIVRKDGQIEIRINGDVAKAGNMVKTSNLMVPPLGVPEFIIDKTATKPLDWDDRPVIYDEDAVKPEDYDEVYGQMWIPNPEIPKPEGWNDDESEPKLIRDPEARKPDEWDDEEDGEWNAPLITNPKCANGCGKWEAPKIINTNYKGEWVRPTKKNPKYKGIWVQPRIKNPDFDENARLPVKTISGLGIEVWSMDSGVLFDNIYLGKSVEEAEKIGNATFGPKSELEYANYQENRPKAKYEPRAPPKSFDELLDEGSSWDIIAPLVNLVTAELATAKNVWLIFQNEPIDVISQHPIRFAFYCFGFVVVFTLVFGVANILVFLYLSSKEPEKTKEKEVAPEEPKPELTDAEIIEQITGKSSGARPKSTSARKVRKT